MHMKYLVIIFLLNIFQHVWHYFAHTYVATYSISIPVAVTSSTFISIEEEQYSNGLLRISSS